MVIGTDSKIVWKDWKVNKKDDEPVQSELTIVCFDILNTRNTKNQVNVWVW